MNTENDASPSLWTCVVCHHTLRAEYRDLHVASNAHFEAVMQLQNFVRRPFVREVFELRFDLFESGEIRSCDMHGPKCDVPFPTTTLDFIRRE